MTSAVLLLRDAGGTVTFDSRLATGGACLGFYTVPSGGGSFSFTAFPSANGVALCAGAGNTALYCTTDNALGYLRFTFPAVSAGLTVVLFAL